MKFCAPAGFERARVLQEFERQVRRIVARDRHPPH